MARTVVIIGAGGHGRVVKSIIEANPVSYYLMGFIDSDPFLKGRAIDGLIVLGDMESIPKGVEYAIIAIGDNKIRQIQYETCRSKGIEIINCIHPQANVAKNVKLEKGIAIAMGANICAGAYIRNGAIINTGAIVEHGCDIGEFAHIAPGAKLAGHVKVRDGAFIGLGACVIQNITIGKNAVIGAGSVVLSDVPDNATVIGCPARDKASIINLERVLQTMTKDTQINEKPIIIPSNPMPDTIPQ